MRTRSSKEFASAGKEEKSTEEVQVASKNGKETEAVEMKAPKSPMSPKSVESPTSEKPVYTIEDVERAKQLFSEGKRNYLCGSMAEAANALAQAAEIYGGFYGDRAPECVEVFYQYGRTLMELARKEPDVVAGAVEGTCLAKIDSEDGEQNESADSAAPDALAPEAGEPDDKMTLDEVREHVLDALDENAVELEKEAAEKAAGGATGENSGAAAGDAPPEVVAGETPAKNDGAADDVAMKEELPEVEEVQEEDTADDIESDGEENKPATEEETLDEIPNLQLAYEFFEMARLILEQCQDKESQERLADIRLALGELAMEDELFDKAIDEFMAAFEIQEKLMPEDDRRIALTHYNIGVAKSLKEDYEPAVKAFEEAVRVLKLRLGTLQTKLAEWKDGDEAEKTELEDDIKEFEALTKDVEARIQDCVESRAQTDAAKEAMQEEQKVAAVDEEKNGVDSKVTDVTHLVRKTVKRDGGANVDEPAKKAKTDPGEVNGKNGHGEKIEDNGIAAE